MAISFDYQFLSVRPFAKGDQILTDAPRRLFSYYYEPNSIYATVRNLSYANNGFTRCLLEV